MNRNTPVDLDALENLCDESDERDLLLIPSVLRPILAELRECRYDRDLILPNDAEEIEAMRQANTRLQAELHASRKELARYADAIDAAVGDAAKSQATQIALETQVRSLIEALDDIARQAMPESFAHRRAWRAIAEFSVKQ